MITRIRRRLARALVALGCMAPLCIHAAPLELNQAESTFVCQPGEPAKVVLRVDSPGPESSMPELAWQVTDVEGRLVESGTAPGTSPTALSFEPAIAQPGYYEFRCQARQGTRDIGSTTGSLVRLAPRATRTEESRFGLYKHGDTGLIDRMRSLGYYRYFAKAGSYWTTSDVWWREIQPDGPNTWNWSVIDKQFADVKAAGLRFLPHLFGTPDWASSFKAGDSVGNDGHKGSVYPPKPEAWEAWGKFVFAFVDRYKDQLDYLRIWNEFDTGYWMGSYKDFAHLLQIASEQARRAKPDIKIVIDVALAKVSVLEALCQEGGAPYFDVISIHNYQLDKVVPPEQTALVDEYRATKAWCAKRFPDRPVWDSEICWLAEPWSFANWYGHGEQAQDQYLARGHMLALLGGMEKVIWFPYHSWAWEEKGKSFEHSGALIRHNMTPRPAFAAYSTVTNVLCDTRFSRRLDLSSDTAYGVEFAGKDRTVTAFWSADNSPEYLTLTTEEPRVAAIDMLGASHDIAPTNRAFTLCLSGSPVYIVSHAPLTRANALCLTSNVSLTWSQPVGTTELTLKFTKASPQAACAIAQLEQVQSADASLPCRVNLFQGRDVEAKASLLMPSQANDGVVRTHLAIQEEGQPPMRFPIALSVPAANKPTWRAESGDGPNEYVRTLSAPAHIGGLLVTFPSGRAYDCAVDVRSKEQWIEIAPFAVRTGSVWVEADRDADAVRLRFRQLVPAASIEPPAAITPAGNTKDLGWSNGTKRDYTTISDEAPHSGAKCIKIDAMNAGRGRVSDELSVAQQIIPVRPNTYYTFSGYAKMPKTQDGWVALFVVGDRPDGSLTPQSFSVLPYLDDQWHKIRIGVRTETDQRTLRFSSTLVGNGLAYFDDLMAVEGTVPTDIPEVVALDVFSRSADGRTTRLP